MPGYGEAYFAILPDRDVAPVVIAALSAPHARVLRHPSGRPWLIGHWPDEEIVVAEAGDTRLVVIGRCGVQTDQLRRQAARLRDPAHLDRLARSLPGSFHLIAVVGGRIHVQGTASGLRLVFHTRLDGLTVAADRADLLAAAAGAPLDRRQLAVRLLWPVPHPLRQAPLWRQVTAVEPGHCLIVAADGRTAHHRRWWDPPEPVRRLADSADDIRRALDEAVGVRTRGGGTVSFDLSGGLGSTSLCHLAAARREARLVAVTWPGRDLPWTGHAAAHLAAHATDRLGDHLADHLTDPTGDHLADHLTDPTGDYLADHLTDPTGDYLADHAAGPADGALLALADPRRVAGTLDEPVIGMLGRGRLPAHVARPAAMGSRLHVTGLGGDHVAWASEAAYHRLLRRRPFLAIRRLRESRTLLRRPLGAMLRALADGRSYRRWLADSAADLREPAPPPVVGALGWGAPPRMLPWITPAAVRLAAEAITQVAPSAEPLAPDRGRHADLHAIRDACRIVRQWEQLSARAGLPMSSPYFDDRVIEACLSVRPQDRVAPWRYQPLLAVAMRGVVSAECLGGAEAAATETDLGYGTGLRELWEDSRLARFGLVDTDALRDLIGRPELHHASLYPTVGCEVWLRTLNSAPQDIPR